MNSGLNRNIAFFALVGCTAFLSFGASIFNWFPYWDDWTIADRNPEQVIHSFSDCGRPQLGYLHAFMIQLPSYQLWYKLFTFLLQMGSALLFFSFSKRVYSLNSQDALLSSIVFATLPIYQAREGFVMLQYSVSLFFLISSVLFYFKHQGRSWLHFIFTFILLTPSLFIEASAPIIMILALYKIVSLLKQKEKTAYKLTYHFLVFLFPVFYIVFIRSALAPASICAGNNNIDLTHLLTLPLGFARSLIDIFLGPIVIQSKLFSQESPFFPLLIPLFLIFLIPLLWKHIKPSQELNAQAIRQQLFISLTLALVAIAPFHMVGKWVTNWDWDSRFQAFLLISAPIIVITITKSIFRAWTHRFIFTLIISVFISTNIGYRLMFLRDNVKVKLLAEQFSKMEDIKNNHSFVIKDLTKSYNVFNRDFRLYDYSGVFKLAFGDEKRVGYIFFNSSERKLVSDALNGPYPDIYMLKNLPTNKASKVDKLIIIKPTERWLSLIDVFKIDILGHRPFPQDFFLISVYDFKSNNETNF